MSELTNARPVGELFRWSLLAGASAAVLLAAIGMSGACADETDRPTVWIELGGQLERVDGGAGAFAPRFFSQINTATFTSPVEIQRLPRYAVGGEGRVSFQPEGSSLSFSVGVRYGRSNNSRKLHQESQPGSAYEYLSVPLFNLHQGAYIPAPAKGFVSTVSRNDESHVVMDFQVGKDVGLGLFGHHSESNVSGGLRFAQFSSASSVSVNADPDFHFSYVHYSHLPPPLPPFPANVDAAIPKWHIDNFKGEVARSFRGLGPTVAWNSSAVIAGNQAEELTFDFGANLAVLFGRQKVQSHHATTSVYHYRQSASAPPDHHSYTYPRSRSVVVPNVGGFAGLSLEFPNAKISFGYRADMFFGAVDGGIDTRKTFDRAFFGPFADFSIGLGG